MADGVEGAVETGVWGAAAAAGGGVAGAGVLTVGAGGGGAADGTDGIDPPKPCQTGTLGACVGATGVGAAGVAAAGEVGEGAGVAGEDVGLVTGDDAAGTSAALPSEPPATGAAGLDGVKYATSGEPSFAAGAAASGSAGTSRSLTNSTAAGSSGAAMDCTSAGWLFVPTPGTTWVSPKIVPPAAMTTAAPVTAVVAVAKASDPIRFMLPSLGIVSGSTSLVMGETSRWFCSRLGNVPRTESKTWAGQIRGPARGGGYNPAT